MDEPLGRRLDRTSPWLLWGLVALGLVITGKGIADGVEQARFAGATRTADGTVVEHRQARRGRQAVLLVVRYQADGHSYEFNSHVSYAPSEHPIGSGVPVVYRADRPASGVIDTFTERWGHVPVYCGLGPLLAVLAAVALAVRSRRRRSR